MPFHAKRTKSRRNEWEPVMTCSGKFSLNKGNRTGDDLLRCGFIFIMRVRELVMTCTGLVSQNEGKRTDHDLLRCGFI